MEKQSFDMKVNNSDFESIIPTALHTAYPLIFTDIPFSKEIFEQLSENGFDDELKNDKLVFELEARHKLIDKFVKESVCGGGNQVLEIASGFTASGLNFCKEDNNIKYVEFDLPQVIQKKKQILNSITEIPKNMFFVEGNALNFDDLEKTFKHFDLSKPIVVVNQGLLRYLDFDEKQRVAENVYKIISRNNGVWITCDFTPAKFVQSQDKNLSAENSKDYNKHLSTITDRNNTSWRFKDKKDVEQFLYKNKLKIEWHEFTESIDMLSSKIEFGLTDEQVIPYLENAYVGVIKLL